MMHLTLVVCGFLFECAMVLLANWELVENSLAHHARIFAILPGRQYVEMTNRGFVAEKKVTGKDVDSCAMEMFEQVPSGLQVVRSEHLHAQRTGAHPSSFLSSYRHPSSSSQSQITSASQILCHHQLSLQHRPQHRYSPLISISDVP
jgi:hypothetical protein